MVSVEYNAYKIHSNSVLHIMSKIVNSGEKK